MEVQQIVVSLNVAQCTNCEKKTIKFGLDLNKQIVGQTVVTAFTMLQQRCIAKMQICKNGKNRKVQPCISPYYKQEEVLLW